MRRFRSGQIAKPVHSMVQKRAFFAVYDTAVVELHYPCPSVAVMDTSAESNKASLDDHVDVKPLQDTMVECMESATMIGVEIDAGDGAFPNKKYERYRELTSLPCDPARLFELCGNHHKHVTEVVLEHMDDGRDAVRSLTRLCTLLPDLTCDDGLQKPPLRKCCSCWR